jgi:hypothetical protein
VTSLATSRLLKSLSGSLNGFRSLAPGVRTTGKRRGSATSASQAGTSDDAGSEVDSAALDTEAAGGESGPLLSAHHLCVELVSHNHATGKGDEDDENEDDDGSKAPTNVPALSVQLLLRTIAVNAGREGAMQAARLCAREVCLLIN